MPLLDTKEFAGVNSFSSRVSAVIHPERRMRAQVQRSWLRCETVLSLSRDDRCGVRYVGQDELRSRRQKVEHILWAAAVEMQNLRRSIHTPIGIALTDADGVIVHCLVVGGFSQVASGSGFREGADWSEEAQGTNGMGTCLVTREPILVKPDEHYLKRNAGITCCAAPIRDGRGTVVAVLNLSCVESGNMGPLVALVSMSARVIESRALLARGEDMHVVRFHSIKSCVTTAGEGILLLDASARVMEASQSASELLREAGRDLVLDQALERTLGFTFDDLTAATRRSPWLPQKMPGTPFFFLLQSPDRAGPFIDGQNACTDGDVLAKAEREALLDVLTSSGWNVSQAARRLKLGRKTMYRKIACYSLVRPSGLL